MECRAVSGLQGVAHGHFGGLEGLATVAAGVVGREGGDVVDHLTIFSLHFYIISAYCYYNCRP